MKISIGTSGYSYKEWRGSFYPDELPTTGMLAFYSRKFPTVEINNTFYRMPKPEMLEEWAKQVPPEFIFILKAPQKITHISRLKDAAQPIEVLWKTAQVLGKQLGPFLFQLPPNMKKNGERLESFLKILPSGMRAAFEFRHESWLDEETYAMLRAHGAALCVATSEKLKVPFVATADWGYLRLRDMEYSAAELQDWANQIRAQKWKEAFVFFKHEDAGKGPMFGEQLGKILGR